MHWPVEPLLDDDEDDDEVVLPELLLDVVVLPELVELLDEVVLPLDVVVLLELDELLLELPPSGKQSGGSVVLPRHSSQCSQVLRHAFTGMQGWHFVGSFTCAMSHEPAPFTVEPSHTYWPVPAGSSQQPKQSQPFGVSGPQKFMQVADCVLYMPSQVALVPDVLALGS